jgi:hypothetical protein
LGLRDVQLRYELSEELRDRTLEMNSALIRQYQSNVTRSATSPIAETAVVDRTDSMESLLAAIGSQECKDLVSEAGVLGLPELVADELRWVDVPDSDSDRDLVEL